MTDQQAAKVLATIMAGTVQQDRSEDELKLLRQWLYPLPFNYCMREALVFVARSARDRDGRSTHAFVNRPAELLDACGLSDKPRVRAEHVRAMREGGRMVRDLRDPDCWSYLPPGAEPSRGVIEAARAAKESFEPQAVAALPPPPKRPEALAAKIEEAVGLLARRRRALTAPERGKGRQAAPADMEGHLAAIDAQFRAALEHERQQQTEE